MTLEAQDQYFKIWQSNLHQYYNTSIAVWKSHYKVMAGLGWVFVCLVGFFFYFPSLTGLSFILLYHTEYIIPFLAKKSSLSINSLQETEKLLGSLCIENRHNITPLLNAQNTSTSQNAAGTVFACADKQ